MCVDLNKDEDEYERKTKQGNSKNDRERGWTCRTCKETKSQRRKEQMAASSR